MDKPQSQDPPQRPGGEGTPFKAMKPLAKAFFVFKVVVCVLTFGMAFPNVMAD